MQILLKNVTILDPQSPFHSSSQDILIQEGIIREISPSISAINGVKTVSFKTFMSPEDGSTPLFPLVSPDMRSEKHYPMALLLLQNQVLLKFY